MKCLIIATGEATHLRQTHDSRPLAVLLGVTLIERVIHLAHEAGADDFFVITGYQGDRVRDFLDHFAERLEIPIASIFVEDWEKGDGVSVFKARGFLREPFLLLTANHLFDPSIASEMTTHPRAGEEILLAVDRDTFNPPISMGDVIHVKTEGGKIRDIARGLTDFNGVYTGISLCTPEIFTALERSSQEHGEMTLEGAVRILATEGRARAVNVKGHFWIDMADQAAFERAENALMANLRGKPNDNALFRYFYRPLAGMITRRLVDYPITPNQISLFSFICSLLAAALFAIGGYAALFTGGLFAQFSMIIDCCDGAVARLKFQISEYGGWFDAVLDRYADAFMLFGLMWHVYADKMDNLILFIGFMAIIGSFVLSYTADKYDSLMRERIRKGREFRVGREARVFVIFLGAIFNQVYFTLALIAVVMNIETIRRIIICRDHE